MFEHKTESFENNFGILKSLKPGILDGVSGDGSVFSSIDDFVIWNKLWNSEDLISESSKVEAFKVPTLNNGEKSYYGFGWSLSPNNNAVWHNGSWLGARTLIIRNMDLKNCMVILDNSSSLYIDKMAQEMVKVFK